MLAERSHPARKKTGNVVALKAESKWPRAKLARQTAAKQCRPASQVINGNSERDGGSSESPLEHKERAACSKLIWTVAKNEQPIDTPEHDSVDRHLRNAQTQNQRGSVGDESSDNAAN